MADFSVLGKLSL